MYTTSQIRKLFLDYFAKCDHVVADSASLIPNGDASLLFINSGMAPFKERFLTVNKHHDKKMVASIQKCMRVGGKHNDLSNVGITNYHHTFFEMCGNFSFGAYGKKEAITMAYNFLTVALNLDKHKMFFSIMKDDLESQKIWLELTQLPEKHIFAQEDNFWSMGDIGPCGPCTEIFYQVEGELLEIWNIVFMEYNQLISGERVPLETICIDTGMGLERIASVVQGVSSNYESDLFRALKNIITKEISSQISEVTQRVISDHMRAAIFLIYDGVVPHHDGRGYILRRIIRRAIKFLYSDGYKEACLSSIISSFMHELARDHCYLLDNIEDTIALIKNEEEQFHALIINQIHVLEKRIHTMKSINDFVIKGDMVFYFYDTHGLPVDFIEDMAQAYGMTIELDSYHLLMQEQKNRSLQHSNLKGNNFTGESKFVGYDHDVTISQVLSIYNDNRQAISTAYHQENVYLVLNQTPFYFESGGQESDYGWIFNKDTGFEFEVLNVKKHGNVITHYGTIRQGHISLNHIVRCEIDVPSRHNTAKNHTATHLLNAALTQCICKSIKQKGSLVTRDKLRFDFSLNRELSKQDLANLENLVNSWIFTNIETKISYHSSADAIKMHSVMLDKFQYGDQLRILHIGKISIEACSGTHVKNLSEIGLFKIIKSVGIASGIKRIVALTGRGVQEYLHHKESLIDTLRDIAKVGQEDHIASKINEVLSNLREKEQQIASLQNQLFDALKSSHLQIEKKLIYGIYKNFSNEFLKQKLSQLAMVHQDTLILLVCLDQNHAMVHIYMPSNHNRSITEKLNTIKNSADWIGGGNRNYYKFKGDKDLLPDLIKFLKT